MATWAEFVAQAPDHAARTEARLRAHKHLTMATIRKDGSPRICGTEIAINHGELLLGGMPGARRFQDLRRDARLALHSGSDAPDSWSGDARVSGIGVEVTDPTQIAILSDAGIDAPAGSFELFRIEITEATVVRLDDPPERLIIETWRPGRAVIRFER